MNGDERALAELVTDPGKVLRLLRKHFPIDGWCCYCRAPSTPVNLCRPFRLALIAAQEHTDEW